MWTKLHKHLRLKEYHPELARMAVLLLYNSVEKLPSSLVLVSPMLEPLEWSYSVSISSLPGEL